MEPLPPPPAGGAAVHHRPDLGLPNLAALLPSPEREGGGSSPKQLGAAVARGGGRRMGAPAASAPAAPAARMEGEGERSRAEEAWRERMGGRGPRGPDALDLFGGFFF